MLEPIEKLSKLIFSLKINIENKTPKGIFKLFITARVEYLTLALPLFHIQKPIPVGKIARYKIDKICAMDNFKEEKLTLLTAKGITNKTAPKYALAIKLVSVFPMYFFHKTCPSAKAQFEPSIKRIPLTNISNEIFCHKITTAPITDNKMQKI